MKEFLKSKSFRVILASLLVLVGFLVYDAANHKGDSLPAKAIATVLAPAQGLSSRIADGVTDFLSKFVNASAISQENVELREQVAMLEQQLVDYEKVKKENEQFREFLQIKEQNQDFEFEPAFVIGRDPTALFGSFMIDKGYLDGIAVNDPVITSEGLVGKIVQVGPNFSHIETILNPSIDVGAINSQSKETGVVMGDPELFEDGLCKMAYLSRESVTKQGDTIVTSGLGGVYPKNLIIGKARSLEHEGNGLSLYAVIEPATEIAKVDDVFVITGFLGQGLSAEEEPEGPLQPED